MDEGKNSVESVFSLVHVLRSSTWDNFLSDYWRLNRRLLPEGWTADTVIFTWQRKRLDGYCCRISSSGIFNKIGTNLSFLLLPVIKTKTQQSFPFWEYLLGMESFETGARSLFSGKNALLPPSDVLYTDCWSKTSTITIKIIFLSSTLLHQPN